MFITNVLAEHAITKPDATAVVFEDRVWSYRELLQHSEKIAAFLLEKGYKKGDIIAQFMLNSDTFLAVYYGVQLAGLTVMPVNTKLAPPEIDYIFHHSEAKVLFYDEKVESLVEQTSYEFKEKINIAQIIEILQGESKLKQKVELDEHDTAVVMYTSGTTGQNR
jgi:long-chain acyl-CoA synthetase